ncbi:MAG: DUF6293 family protein [Methanomassiliicoccales archaeon]|jgi:hypothetical protein
MRTLICTYGYRQDKIVKAMRTIDHDELVIVTGKENTSRPEYARILELARKLDTPFETVIVDIFDFMSCFSRIDDLVRKRQAANHMVTINISGGLWLLSDAAMMAALNNGCESYYVDDVVKKMPVMLPVLKVNIGERLTFAQKRTLLELKEGTPVPMFSSRDNGSQPRMRALRELKRMGVVSVDLSSGVARIILTPSGSSILDWLKRS